MWSAFSVIIFQWICFIVWLYWYRYVNIEIKKQHDDPVNVAMFTSTSINVNVELCNLLARGAVQYIPRNMHTVFALLCFVVVLHWLIFPYPSGLLHWHCGNLTIAPVPAKQPWWIWINTSCEFIMNDCITTTKQSTTKPCAYFLGYTVGARNNMTCPPESHLNVKSRKIPLAHMFYCGRWILLTLAQRPSYFHVLCNFSL